MDHISCVALDLDDTLWECNPYPFIGQVNFELLDIIKSFHRAGGKVIINTCREDIQAAYAIEKLNEIGLKYDAFNENLPERIKQYGSDCRKIGADTYIDLKTPGCTIEAIREALLSPENLKQLRMKPRFKLNAKR